MLSTETKSYASVCGVDSISGVSGATNETCAQAAILPRENHAIKGTIEKLM